jgi:hypothetical protein
VTVLLGLRTSAIFRRFDSEMSDAALILSAVMTIITAWESFADHSWSWVRYRTTLGILYKISDDLEYELSKSTTIDLSKIDEIHDRMMDSLQEIETEWRVVRAKSITRTIS